MLHITKVLLIFLEHFVWQEMHLMQTSSQITESWLCSFIQTNAKTQSQTMHLKVIIKNDIEVLIVQIQFVCMILGQGGHTFYNLLKNVDPPEIS